MHIDRQKIPKSSFLSVEKDAEIITRKLLSSERLKRLLYYNTSDALTKPNLSKEDSIALLGKNIRLVPKVYVDDEVLNYIILQFDNFVENENPQFRDNIVEFDIICHFSQWQLQDFQLRPFRIAAEIDSLLDKQYLTGIGKLQFLGCNKIVLTEELAGYCLQYYTIHGGEDKYGMPNPQDEQQFLDDFYDKMEDPINGPTIGANRRG